MPGKNIIRQGVIKIRNDGNINMNMLRILHLPEIEFR